MEEPELSMGRGRNVGRGFYELKRLGATFASVLLLIFHFLPAPVFATHEADHRFSVEGYVCGVDGAAITEEKVIVKNTRAKVSKAVFTDSDGYYKATLHLHNDNVGDPLLITVKDQERQAKVAFDPKDLESERSILVNFGQGCEKEGLSQTVLIVLGLVGVVFAVGVAVLMTKKKRPQGKTKGKRK